MYGRRGDERSIWLSRLAINNRHGNRAACLMTAPRLFGRSASTTNSGVYCLGSHGRLETGGGVARVGICVPCVCALIRMCVPMYVCHVCVR